MTAGIHNDSLRLYSSKITQYTPMIPKGSFHPSETVRKSVPVQKVMSPGLHTEYGISIAVQPLRGNLDLRSADSTHTSIVDVTAYPIFLGII